MVEDGIIQKLFELNLLKNWYEVLGVDKLHNNLHLGPNNKSELFKQKVRICLAYFLYFQSKYNGREWWTEEMEAKFADRVTTGDMLQT